MSQEQNGFVLRKGQKDLIEHLPSTKLKAAIIFDCPTGYGMSTHLSWGDVLRAMATDRLLIVAPKTVWIKEE